MATWRYGRTNCFEARYEDLRQDRELVTWRRIPGLLPSLGYETSDDRVLELEDGPATGLLSEFRQFAARPPETFAGPARGPLRF